MVARSRLRPGPAPSWTYAPEFVRKKTRHSGYGRARKHGSSADRRATDSWATTAATEQTMAVVNSAMLRVTMRLEYAAASPNTRMRIAPSKM